MPTFLRRGRWDCVGERCASPTPRTTYEFKRCSRERSREALGNIVLAELNRLTICMIHRQAQWIVTTVSARNKENGYEKLTNNQPKPDFCRYSPPEPRYTSPDNRGLGEQDWRKTFKLNLAINVMVLEE